MIHLLKSSLFVFFFIPTVFQLKAQLVDMDSLKKNDLPEWIEELKRDNISSNSSLKNANLRTEELAVMKERLKLQRIERELKSKFNQEKIDNQSNYFLFSTYATQVSDQHTELLAVQIKDIREKFVSELHQKIEYEIDSFLLRVEQPYKIRLRIVGFASPDGSETLNLRLSEDRADSVANLFREELDDIEIANFIVTSSGRGENIMHEMRHLPNIYKRSALIFIEDIVLSTDDELESISNSLSEEKTELRE
jgi:outer membrane protein OmpA-like peptidoglycan-associated protein